MYNLWKTRYYLEFIYYIIELNYYLILPVTTPPLCGFCNTLHVTFSLEASLRCRK